MIGAHNWYPNYENYAIVDPLFAKIFFLIGGGIPLNFGKLAFDLIVNNENVFWERYALPFPSLIHHVLTSQDYN